MRIDDTGSCVAKLTTLLPGDVFKYCSLYYMKMSVAGMEHKFHECELAVGLEDGIVTSFSNSTEYLVTHYPEAELRLHHRYQPQ